MKIALIVAFLALAGCSMGSKTWEEVAKAFPGGDVARLPAEAGGASHQYIVRDTNGAIWFVECAGATRKITGKAMIMQPRL